MSTEQDESKSDRWKNVDPMFDGHLETPLLKMTVQQRLDWIDEMMRMRTEWKPSPTPPKFEES